MVPRRFCVLLLLVLALTLAGCVTLERSHVTIYAERNESETADDKKGRTVGSKEGVSVTFDLR